VRDVGKILVIGAGPGGLGAAWALQDAGYADWELFEKDHGVGGLASSYVDEHGFTWDLGGHVVFSHYDTFEAVLDALPGQAWVEHVREAWIWMRGRFIPYPLQNNLRHLPAAELSECLQGLREAHTRAAQTPPASFADWIQQSFGAGLARMFLNPYNRKVWATDPVRLSAQWVAERVAPADLDGVLRRLAEGQDDVGWGPNATFRFPLHGGTGRLWSTLAGRLPADHLHLGREIAGIDSRTRVLHFPDGATARYDWLITTMPLDLLLARIQDAGGDPNPQFAIRNPQSLGGQLRYSSIHVIGVGVDGPVPAPLATKCWIYFPEPELPFYRVTVFSNYSPNNVPSPGRQWSLLAEVSESAAGGPPEWTRANVVRRTLAGLRSAGLLAPEAALRSTWHRRVERAYPVPLRERDALLDTIEPWLYARNILSRGRFGAWKYEVGNMDHSFMQGVEAVRHLLDGAPEITRHSPAVVNSRKPCRRA
jgi:protoporphyrinogen oxidase